MTMPTGHACPTCEQENDRLRAALEKVAALPSFAPGDGPDVARTALALACAAAVTKAQKG